MAIALNSGVEMSHNELSITSKKTYICDVCGEPLSTLFTPKQSAGNYCVCRSFECQNIIEKRPTMKPHSFKCFFEFHRSQIKKRKHFISQEKQRVQNLKSKHDSEHQIILDEILATNPSLHADQIQLVEIPSGVLKTSPLGSERLKRYTDYLRGLLDKANEYSNAECVPFDDQLELHEKRMVIDLHLKENPKAKEISEAMCGMCKGGCCTQGKDTAYLSVLTVRRYMDAHPAQSVESVLNDYLSLLSDTPVTNSCINQTNKGCGLTRNMRSDLCNGYFCDSIMAYQKQSESTHKSVSVLAIQRANTNWNRLEPNVDKQVVDKKLFSSENRRVSK